MSKVLPDTDGVDLGGHTAYGEHGRIMLNGEWESSKAIHNLLPEFIPKPIGFGKYKTEKKPATYFYLCDFVDMDIGAIYRENSETTQEEPLANRQDWAKFFQKLLVGVCKLDLATNGPWTELEQATAQVVAKVIPRLLGALTSGGEKIKPCLIHGDLYEANAGIDVETGEKHSV
ncbi:MAG: hypothetical protein Q9190_007147 [Brigantiaea leucoxantha]